MLECISISIAIISLLLSVYNFVRSIFIQRCKVKVIVHEHFNKNATHQFHLTFENCSQLPISISSICINKNNFCVLEPTLVREVTRRVGNEVIGRTETKTIPFPINLNPLQSYSGYVEFREMNNFDKNNFSISIFTNRKAIKNATVVTHGDLTKKL